MLISITVTDRMRLWLGRDEVMAEKTSELLKPAIRRQKV